MNRQAVSGKRELENAFQTFNRISEQLAESYHALEEQVAQLNADLAHAHGERHRQLTEKERIANRLERLLDALPAGVVVLDGKGIVQEVNSVTRDLLGEPLLGLFWLEVINRAFSVRPGDFNEVRLHDGRVLSISTSPLGSEPGQIVLLHDITETCHLQERLSRHQRLSAMGEMAASLAHQIRTPLASALLYASQTGSERIEPGQRKRLSEKLLARLRYLEQLVNDMLLFARGGGAGAEQLDVKEFLNELQIGLETQLKTTSAKFAVINNVSGGRLRGNGSALTGALQNLVINAIQACGEHASITLTATWGLDKSGQPTIDLAVNDNGPGIPETARERIFEPFFTTRSQGTGLGLAVVQAVALAHHGAVWVESVPGKGSTFTLRLPVYDPVPQIQPPTNLPEVERKAI